MSKPSEENQIQPKFSFIVFERSNLLVKFDYIQRYILQAIRKEQNSTNISQFHFKPYPKVFTVLKSNVRKSQTLARRVGR